MKFFIELEILKIFLSRVKFLGFGARFCKSYFLSEQGTHLLDWAYCDLSLFLLSYHFFSSFVQSFCQNAKCKIKSLIILCTLVIKFYLTHFKNKTWHCKKGKNCIKSFSQCQNTQNYVILIPFTSLDVQDAQDHLPYVQI